MRSLNGKTKWSHTQYKYKRRQTTCNTAAQHHHHKSFYSNMRTLSKHTADKCTWSSVSIENGSTTTSQKLGVYILFSPSPSFHFSVIPTLWRQLGLGTWPPNGFGGCWGENVGYWSVVTVVLKSTPVVQCRSQLQVTRYTKFWGVGQLNVDFWGVQTLVTPTVAAPLTETATVLSYNTLSSTFVHMLQYCQQQHSQKMLYMLDSTAENDNCITSSSLHFI